MIPFGNFQFFAILFALLLPAVACGLIGKGLRAYSVVLTFVFIWIIYGNNPPELLSLVFYVLYQWAILWFNLRWKRRGWMYRLSIVLSLLPLVLVKLVPLLQIQSVIGFLGISYVTFRGVHMLMEIRDGLIKKDTFRFRHYVYFLLFFPTISSGPIDRYRRFAADLRQPLTRTHYAEYLYLGIHRIFRGFLYKFILAHLIHKYVLSFSSQAYVLTNSSSENEVMSQFLFHLYYTYFFTVTSQLNFNTWVADIFHIYGYSLYLFFDFAGYTAFAVGVSYILGIRTPENFNMPFISRNIKEFWNRWNMTLSFWFRDYVFMRIVLALTRKKIMTNRQLISYFGYVGLFGLMGFWHGLELHYIVYGFYQAALFILYDLFNRFNKRYGLWKDNVATRLISIFITFQFVCFGFFIFSGYFFE